MKSAGPPFAAMFFLLAITACNQADTRADDEKSIRGELLEVWKKQADGGWKCVADTYNSNAASVPAPEWKK